MPMWGAIRKAGRLFIDRQWFALFLMTLGLYIATIALAITSTAQHSSDLATERTRQSVSIALKQFVEDLLTRAEESSQHFIYQSQKTDSGIDASSSIARWQEQTRIGKHFNSVLLFDAKQRPVLHISNGVKHASASDREVDAGIAAYGRHFATQADLTGGFAFISNRLLAIAVAKIHPVQPIIVSPNSGVPAYAVFVKRLDKPAIGKIASSLQLGELSLVGRSDSANSAPIVDVAGKSLASIKWPTPGSRWDALMRVLPWLSLLMALNVALTGYLIRTGIRRVNDLGNQATVDALSGLANRRALRDALADASFNHETVALALMDLDGFKQVNDTYGHDVGDALIKVAADAIAKHQCETTLAIRLGGDEFALLVRGEDVANRIEAMAEDMIHGMQKTVRIGARSLHVSVSIGLATADLTECDGLEAMRRADVAMYASKRAGKRCYTWFQDKHDHAQAEEKALAREIQAALGTGEFSVVYQPVYAAKDRKIVGVEALLRWHSPSRGDVPPNVFIPVADKTGLITPISHHLLKHVARDCQSWGNIPIALNMTAAHMRQTDFIESLQGSLASAGLSPGQIEIEMSETLYLSDKDRVTAISKQLAQMGVALTLDDFGSGATALNALREGGFSAVKLDRELVRQAEHDSVALALLQSGIAVAHSLEMIVVAEGVETEAQAELMTVAGCDQLQGWLFGQAVDGIKMNSIVNLDSRKPEAA